MKNFEQPEQQTEQEARVTVPYLENYAIAAQNKAHIKPELDRILRNPDYDTENHFETCEKCRVKAKEMIDRDTRKLGKLSKDPGWMIK